MLNEISNKSLTVRGLSYGLPRDTNNSPVV
jgi:hypothetical protein